MDLLVILLHKAKLPLLYLLIRNLQYGNLTVLVFLKKERLKAILYNYKNYHSNFHFCMNQEHKLQKD